MKTNLKTRYPYKNTYKDYFEKTEKWFEDFEAELWQLAEVYPIIKELLGE